MTNHFQNQVSGSEEIFCVFYPILYINNGVRNTLNSSPEIENDDFFLELF